MAEIQLVRMPNIEITDAERQAARRVIFGHVDGVGEKNQARWRRFWNRLLRMEAGEIQSVQTLMQRSGPFHRRHMAIEQAVFNAQERFDDFEQFRYWLKVGAAWVTWAAGPKGGVVPSRVRSATQMPMKTNSASTTQPLSDSCVAHMRPRFCGVIWARRRTT